MKALVFKNKVVQIEPDNSENEDGFPFPVSPEMEWIDSEDAEIGDDYDGSVFSHPPVYVPTDLEKWEQDIAATDHGMPRYIEDIIDALSVSVRDKIALETLDKYNAKKTLRAQKP